MHFYPECTNDPEGIQIFLLLQGMGIEGWDKQPDYIAKGLLNGCWSRGTVSFMCCFSLKPHNSPLPIITNFQMRNLTWRLCSLPKVRELM